jgi:multidrug transporter EmrE-like cation transporter
MSFETIIPLSIIETIGDFALERFANQGGVLPLSLGITSYMGVVYFLIQALKGSSVLLVNGAWDGINALIVSSAAYFILGERFDHYSQYVGLVFIIVGVYLLKIPMTKKRYK